MGRRMTDYKHILVGMDLSKESAQVLKRAAQIAAYSNAKLSLSHIIEPLTFAYGGDIPMDLSEVQEQIHQQAQEQLKKAAKPLKIPADRQHVVLGRPAAEIHRIAREFDVDLITIGSHGYHGLTLLLGSTASGVLHGAHCDVLAVRIKKRPK